MSNFLERMNATRSDDVEADENAVYTESGDATINHKIEDSRRRAADGKAQYQRQCEAYHRWRRGEQVNDDAHECEALVAYAPFDPAVVRNGQPVRIAVFVAANADPSGHVARVRAAVAGATVDVDVIRAGDPHPSLSQLQQRDATVVLFLLPGFDARADRQWLFETVRFAGFAATNYGNFAMLYAGATADDYIWVLVARAGASADDWQRRWLKKDGTR